MRAREQAALRGLEGAEPIERLVATQRVWKSFVGRFEEIQPAEDLADNHESASRVLRRVTDLHDSWIDEMQTLPSFDQQQAYLSQLDSSEEDSLLSEFRERLKRVGATSCNAL